MGMHFKVSHVRSAKDLGADAPSACYQAMTDTFGAAPWQVGTDELPVLRAMAAVATGESFYRDLIASVEQHGAIVVQPVS
jgi:hypothetical protein